MAAPQPMDRSLRLQAQKAFRLWQTNRLLAQQLLLWTRSRRNR